MNVNARVLVVRARDGAEALAAALHARGVEALVAPLTRQRALAVSDLDALVARCEWVAFASAAAVEFLGVRVDSLGVKRVAAVGPASARALSALGSRVLVPPEGAHDGAGLAKALLAAGARRVLVPRAKDGRDELVDALRAAGVEVDAPAVYETVAAPGAAESLEAALGAGPRAVALSAPSSARALVDVAAALSPARLALVRALPAACIGETTAAAARALGLTVAAVAASPSVEALADAAAALVR